MGFKVARLLDKSFVLLDFERGEAFHGDWEAVLTQLTQHCGVDPDHAFEIYLDLVGVEALNDCLGPTPVKKQIA